MVADATQAVMTLIAITQHRGRLHIPTDQTWIETLLRAHQDRVAPPRRHHRPRPARSRARPNPDRVQQRPVARGDRLRHPRRRTRRTPANRPARLAGKASQEPDNNGSNPTAGTRTRALRRRHDLVHSQHDLRGKVRHPSTGLDKSSTGVRGACSALVGSGRHDRSGTSGAETASHVAGVLRPRPRPRHSDCRVL
jgi:hypothetical protein